MARKQMFKHENFAGGTYFIYDSKKKGYTLKRGETIVIDTVRVCAGVRISSVWVDDEGNVIPEEEKKVIRKVRTVKDKDKTESD